MSLQVGLIGCGNISDIYLANAAQFSGFDIVACADIRAEAAQAQAARYGARALSVEDLLADPGIDAVLNLTVPAAHAGICLKALEAGKHVYVEKPLATDLEDARAIVARAQAKGLRVGCAPDTILGPGIQNAKKAIAGGAIGKPITGLAAVLSHGMEHWHPNPDFFFKPGAGPVLDLGPYYVSALTTLMGPVARVRASGRIGNAFRTVTAEGATKGHRIEVETPTTLNALLSFENGAELVLMASWDVWNSDVRPIEIHGETASLRVPDPNWFGGRIEISGGGEPWQPRDTDGQVFGRANYAFLDGVYPNYRGLGLADMAKGIAEGRPHRCSGEFGLHTLEVMLAILDSASRGESVEIASTIPRTPPLEEDEARGLVAEGSPWLDFSAPAAATAKAQ